MNKERADLGFGGELDDFNPDDWTPKPTKKTIARPKPEQTEKVAVAAGFKSREPSKPTAKPQKQQRRRRTGRNVQFNIKTRQDTIDAFCAIADGQGWGIGETLEQAVELLEKKYGKTS
jgi:hypothetical protein